MNKTGLLAGIAVIAMATPAAAQIRSYHVELPAQPLSQSLFRISELTGLQVVFNEVDITHFIARPLSGSFTPEQMLGQLLHSSGYAFTISGNVVRVYRTTMPVAAKINTAATAEPADAPAYNPPAPAAPPAAEGEIVVTAQGRAQSLQDVPISVSVVSGSDLTKANIQTMEGVSTRVSAVKVTSGGVADQLHIRGIGSGLNPGFEQSVATFVDGVYRNRSRAIRAALFDIERVEVLKGPQTTFFGNNAIAGAFNITTRKPGHSFDYNASALYGSFGQYALEGGVDIPLGSTLSVRLVGRAYGMNGYIENAYTGNKGPHQRNWIGRATAVWEPTDNFKSTLRFDRGRMRVTESNAAEMMFCPPDGLPAVGLCARYIAANGGPVDDKLNLHTSVYPGVFNYDFHELAWLNELKLGGGYTISANTGYFKHNLDFRNISFPVPLVGVAGLPGSLPYSEPEKYHSFSQELRLLSPEDKRFSFMIGGYYYRGKLNFLEYDVYTQAPFGAFLAPFYAADDPITTYTYFNQKDSIKSVFGSVTYRLTDSLRINGGLRYSVVHKHVVRGVIGGELLGSNPYPTAATFLPGTPAQQDAINGFFAYSPADVAEDVRRTDKKLMPTVSVQYDIVPEVTAYASVTKGFKAGGFSAYTSNAFKPENVTDYEAGIKGQFFDKRLTLNLTGFWSNYKNLQETSFVALPDGRFTAFIANAGKARSRGVEMSGALRASDLLSFHTDLAYVDAQYTYFPDGPCTGIQAATTTNCFQDLKGKRRPYAPKWSGSFGANLSVPVENMMLTIDPVVRFSSSYFQQSNNDPLLLQKGYAKLDLRVGFGPEDKHWEMSVIGTNLTDKITRGFSNNLGQSPGSVWAYPEQGRSVSIQFSIKR